MHFDLIIPTYNRCQLLGRTLASVEAAVIPPGMEVCVTVVDNNSRDNTRSIVDEWRSKLSCRLNYLHGTRQGRSNALNAGIRATTGDLIGMIDDDEELSVNWFVVAQKAFLSNDIDFIGGPCLPNWGGVQPDWLPKSYRGVIGWVENGNESKAFEANSPAILTGGNSIIRREILERAGLYSGALGRTDKKLLSCEDEEFYHRLLKTGAKGLYIPELAIKHFVPKERLTRSYHRSWRFWRGVSLGVLEREQQDEVAYLFGVPRYLFGNASRGSIKKAFGIIAGVSASERFDGELAIWDLAGILYGKHFYKSGQLANDPGISSETGKLSAGRSAE